MVFFINKTLSDLRSFICFDKTYFLFSVKTINILTITR